MKCCESSFMLTLCDMTMHAVESEKSSVFPLQLTVSIDKTWPDLHLSGEQW